MEEALKSATESDNGAPSVVSSVSCAVISRDARLFAGLTFGRFAHRLRDIGPATIVVGAVSKGRPVGLALGVHNNDGSCELLSIAVASSARREGIGAKLIAAWEAEAQRRGGNSVKAQYNETSAGREAFEALVAKAGWTGPFEDGLVVLGRAGPMADVVGNWKAISGRLSQPELYSYSPVELTEADIEAVNRYMSELDMGNMVGPVACLSSIVPECSVIIRRDGVLVGWVLAMEAEEGMATLHSGENCAIRYSEAFLDPAYWHSGITIGAYYHCYAAQARVFGRESTAIYYTNPTRPRMVALTRRRFAGIADRVETIFAVSRKLNGI